MLPTIKPLVTKATLDSMSWGEAGMEKKEDTGSR